MATALAQLRTRTLSAASRFHDYNFRLYFTQKAADVFDEVAKKPAAEIEEWCKTTGEAQLDQMERMAVLNRTYARTPVFLDPDLLKSGSVGSANGGGATDAEAALPHGGPANRKLMPEEDLDAEDHPEGKSSSSHH